MKNVDQLKAELTALRQRRMFKEISDDFAFTNGSLSRIDADIRAKEREIERAITDYSEVV